MILDLFLLGLSIYVVCALHYKSQNTQHYYSQSNMLGRLVKNTCDNVQTIFLNYDNYM